MEITYDYALTDLSRVKTLMNAGDDNDLVIMRKINAVTDYIERECRRRFAETTYTNQVLSVPGYSQGRLYLPQRPVTSITKIEYRQGVSSSPTWVTYASSGYELEGDGSSGIVCFTGYSGFLPQGINQVRATYIAGYKIDWQNSGDITQHNLPADITELAERLVVSWYNNRLKHGKESEKFHDNTVVYSGDLTEQDKTILSWYRNAPQMF